MARIIKFIALTLVIISALLLGISCTPQRKPVDPNRGAPIDPDREGQNIGDRVDRDTRRIDPKPDAQRTADDIARQVAKIPGVENAYVVITGKTALIGLDLDNNITGKTTTNIKKQAAKKATDNKGITDAQVTSNPDLVGRVKDIADGIRTGRPLSEFGDQIMEIINRIKTQS